MDPGVGVTVVFPPLIGIGTGQACAVVELAHPTTVVPFIACTLDEF